MSILDDGSPVISTARLRLRAPQAEDAPRMAQLANDAAVARMTSRMPHPYSLADAEAYVVRCGQKDAARERAFVVEQEGEGLIGMLGFHPDEEGRTELGYWLGRPYWGRGFATEAAEAALVWAGEAWKRRYLVSGHFVDNPASGNVLCKAGFLYTGDVLPRHSLARGEPAPTRMMVWLA